MKEKNWMKKLLLIGLIVLVLVLLMVSFATPLLAHGPDDARATPSNGEAREEMHQACENGDYETMTEWYDQCHGAEDTMNEGMMRDGMMGSSMMGGMH